MFLEVLENFHPPCAACKELPVSQCHLRMSVNTEEHLQQKLMSLRNMSSNGLPQIDRYLIKVNGLLQTACGIAGLMIECSGAGF